MDFINRGHFSAFAAVTKKSAEYYDQPGDKIDVIVIVSYAIGFPGALLCACLGESMGVKFCLRFSAGLTVLGMVIKWGKAFDSLKNFRVT